MNALSSVVKNTIKKSCMMSLLILSDIMNIFNNNKPFRTFTSRMNSLGNVNNVINLKLLNF